MRRPYQILMPLLGLFFCRVDLTDQFPLTIPVTVEKVYDGDTLLVKKGSYSWKVRLSLIDSPEKGQRFLNSTIDAGKVSSDCLNEVMVGRNQVLKVKAFDMYGRILGDVGKLNFELIEKGCTTLYPFARFDSIAEKFLYLKALKKAKALKQGLWQYGGFLQPKLYRKISKRYGHRQ